MYFKEKIVQKYISISKLDDILKVDNFRKKIIFPKIMIQMQRFLDTYFVKGIQLLVLVYIQGYNKMPQENGVNVLISL